MFTSWRKKGKRRRLLRCLAVEASSRGRAWISRSLFSATWLRKAFGAFKENKLLGSANLDRAWAFWMLWTWKKTFSLWKDFARWELSSRLKKADERAASRLAKFAFGQWLVLVNQSKAAVVLAAEQNKIKNSLENWIKNEVKLSEAVPDCKLYEFSFD